MVRQIITAFIFAAILVPSWQIGSIFFEKFNVTSLLEEHANSIRKSNYYEGMIEKNLKKDLEKKGLPTEFTVQLLKKGRTTGKVRISYRYNSVASIFGYPYYETNDIITVETEEYHGY